MKQQMARLTTLAAALLLCVAGILSTAAQAQSYDVIYGENNPIPAIAERVRPAVVLVISSKETWSREQGRRVVEAGYGSGVYIDAEGYVVTNYHVISDADIVEIETMDGERMAVESTFYDASTDLALLRLQEPLDAEPVPLGDSDALRVGELAIVIGNPGLQDRVFFGTVTAGIVSGLDRRDVNAGNFSRTVNTIQVDAAINAGNSGGALLNAQGELVGIPTLKAGSEYGTNYEGLGFCIPVNTVREITGQLKEYGVVRRPRMGILISEMEGPDEPIPGYPPAGLLVTEIEEGSPAQQAGILLYDVITHANGVRVARFTDLSDLTDTMSAGDVLHLSVYRCYDPVQGFLLPDPQSIELDVELKILD